MTSLRRQSESSATAGPFRTDSALFVGLLVGVIVIVGSLTFLPAFVLGPIARHLAGGPLF